MPTGSVNFATTSHSSSIKTRVGKYELGRTLGEGNFAKVKFARNTETGEYVAIKILDKEKILKHKLIGQVCGNSGHFVIILCNFFPIIYNIFS